ncbi:MAG: TenA family protein [Leptolyngbyaceae cyanobacterium CSU_1_4]|nr:TenA family protein [Leptolyngbyaceae cyanobacterium CSU_1_4]
MSIVEESIAEELWQENQDLAIACLQHSFVQSTADGSLPKAKFAYYVGQDAFFLEAFARAYSIAAAKAPDWQGFKVFHDLASGVLQELTLHQTYASEWNIDLKTVAPGSATRRYTDFLLATAWSQTVGVTAAAMLPCMKLYAFLGQSLAANGIPAHDYADWIRTYSSKEFEPLVGRLTELVEQYLGTKQEGQPSAYLQSSTVYRYAMQCELDFFQAAWTVG